MFRFNATLHNLPGEVPRGDAVSLRGLSLPTLTPATAELYTSFGCTFEETAARLERHPRVHFELDGSFVWGEGAGAERWQIDGHLFDRGGKLLYAHLKGTCPGEVFDHLLSTVGWPQSAVMLQLQQEGYVLDEATFRRYASAE